MARVLLGVTGGIAAYKACELPTPRQGRPRGDADPDAGSRAVRDRAHLRGARPPRGAARPLSAPRRRRPARHRAALGEHAREARARARRQRPHPVGARLPRARPRRAGDERPHVGAPGDPGERAPRSPSAASSCSGPRRASSPRASTGPAAWWSRSDLRALPGAPRPDRPARRQARRRLGGRHAGAHRPRALRRQPLVGADGRRRRRRGEAARRRRHARLRERRRPTPAGVEVVPARPRPTSAARCSRARMPTSSSWPPPSPTTDPAIRRAASARKTGSRGRSPSSRPTTCSPSWAGGSRTARSSWASRRRAARTVSSGPAASSPTRTGTFSSSTTYLNPGHRLRVRGQRGRPPLGTRRAEGRQAKQGGMCSGYPR